MSGERKLTTEFVKGVFSRYSPTWNGADFDVWLRAVEAAVRADQADVLKAAERERDEYMERFRNVSDANSDILDQLWAAQAVIADVNELADAISKESHCSHLGRDIRTLTAQSPTDALQAVKAAAWDEAQAASNRMVNTPLGYHFEYVPAPNPYRAAALVPGTPETAEGEVGK